MNTSPLSITLTQYLLFVAALGVCVLAFLRPSAIPDFLVTLLFVSPAYVLCERGRMGLGVVFVGLLLAAAAVFLRSRFSVKVFGLLFL